MRVFGIQDDGVFTEYDHVPFEVEHEEKTLEDWLESNPDGILEDSGVLTNRASGLAPTSEDSLTCSVWTVPGIRSWSR